MPSPALLLKDLFFVHDCNPTVVNDLVNFDKLRLLANIVRFTDAFRFVRYDHLNDVRERVQLPGWAGLVRSGPFAHAGGARVARPLCSSRT